MSTRKWLFIGLLVLGVAGFSSRDAVAGPTFTGFSFNWGTIDCLSVLRSLPKKDAPFTIIGCSAKMKEVTLECVNKGGNADSSSALKFQPVESDPITVTATANACFLEKSTGRWFCNQQISTAALEAELLEQDVPIGGACGPNPNFSLALDVVTKMCAQVFLIDADGFLVDQRFARCTLPPDSPSGTPFTCTEITEAQFIECNIDDFPV